jgi:hypothetical protein
MRLMTGSRLARLRSPRVALLAIATGGVLTSLLSVGAQAAVPAAGATASMVVPVDRQDYVTTGMTTDPYNGTTIDAYDGDPSSIHVAVNAGQTYAHSFVHLAMDYLPAGAVATKTVMTLYVTQQSDASNTGVYPAYNVNSSQAIVEACALTTELPANYDFNNPPSYDCAHGSAIGKASKDGLSWSFDLSHLIGYWQQHGNTGAALIPISADPSQTWSVAYYKSRSTATVSYLTAPVSPPSSGGSSLGNSSNPTTSVANPPAANGPTTTVAPPTGAGVSTPVAVPPTVAGTNPAPAGSAPVTVRSTDSSSPVWPWVLVASILVAAGAVAWPHRATLVSRLPRLGALWRTHSRAYSVAAAALAWGLVFSCYSVVTSPTHHGEQLASDQQGTGSSQTGAVTPSSTTPGAASSPGVATSTGAAGAVTSGAAASTTQQTANVSARAAATEFTGAGTWHVINGVRVFFPSGGGVPVADLFHGADDTVGITNNQLRICAHAALTYGAAFHISASDLDVWWSKVNKEMGGIYGRQVATNYQNDNYDPGTAVQAAQTCKDWSTFLLLGGIGFDQIPAVRQWAEQNHMLYLHHIATIEGTAGLRYSFSALPTVEQMGVQLGEIAARALPHKKIAIIYRQSSNWTPALAPFEKLAEASGSKIVGTYGVQINQGNYTQELTEARSAGAEVVLSWENALSEIEMIKQAQAQGWHPAWLVNGFNIITNTLGSTALDQDMWSAGDWDAYDPNYYGGGFASYAAQIHEFEAEYKKYDPGADLTGDGGDLLFLNWESQRWLYQLLLDCGKTCTRNKLAGLLLAGFHTTVPPNCPASFEHTADHHHAGYLFNVLHAVRDPNGRPNFVPVARCVSNW